MSKTLPITLPYLGMDVLSSETAIVKGAVRSAINVDIGRAGRYARRNGFTKQLSTDGLHSLYHAAQKGWTLVAKDNVVNRLDTSSYALTPLFTAASADPFDYTEYNGNLYISNRSSFGWVPSDSTTARQVGVPTPDAPLLSAGPGGLLAGTYGLVITYVDDRGEEGGASALSTIELPEGGGIRLSNLSIPAGYRAYVYVTSTDGDVMRWVAAIPHVFVNYVVGEQSMGSKCDNQHLVPMPGGSIVRWHNGRLVTAHLGTLRVSEPLQPHLHNPAHGVIPFSGFISFVESVNDGLFVGDSRGIWFLSGNDPSKFDARRVSTCRAAMRSSIMVPSEHFPQKMVQTDQPVALWLSTSGYVVGMPGGTTVELHPDRIKVPPGLTGRSVFLLRNGRKQVITPVNSSVAAAFGVAVDSDIP